MGVRIVVPPFPFDDEATFESFSKNAAIVFKRPVTEGIHIEDVKIVNQQWLVAGTSGVVLIVVLRGHRSLVTSGPDIVCAWHRHTAASAAARIVRKLRIAIEGPL